jgi:hypothetical protein
MMRVCQRVATLAAAAAAISCAIARTPAPPAAPIVRTVAVVVTDGAQPIAGATCTIDQAPAARGAAGADGYVAWDGIADSRRDLQLTCAADGYLPFSEHRALTTAGNEDLAPVTLTPVRRDRDAGERGRVRVDGLVFRHEDGSLFQWRGCTDFLLLKRFREEPDHSALRAVVNERIAAGCNTFRVLGMVDSFASLRVDDAYYDDLGAFADFLAGFGARLEFVVFADAQVVLPDAQAEKVHADMVARVLAPKWNVFVEAVNEPFKNVPGGAAAADGLAGILRGHGFPVASGNYDVPTCAASFAHADYVTVHSERKPDWPRTARALAEIRDGFGWGACGTFAGVRVPVVGDEPIGFAETEQPGKRSASVDDAAYFAATCGLMGAGCTFHSDDGVTSLPWSPTQHAAAEAFYAALQWVPAEAQLAPYIRGGTAPGCQWLGESIAEHDDAQELRSFAKVIGDQAWLVQIRTTRAAVVPCGAWRVVETPRRGLARLVR